MQDSWFVTLHFLCICRLLLMCSSFVKFPQATGNADSSWLVFPHCSWTLSHADRSLLLRYRLSLCISLRELLLWSVFPCPLPVSSRSRAQAFVLFRAKTNKKIVCLAHPLHSVIFQAISLCFCFCYFYICAFVAILWLAALIRLSLIFIM